MLIPGHLTGCGEIPAEPPGFLCFKTLGTASLPRHHGDSSAGPWAQPHFHATMETLLQGTRGPGSLSGLTTLRPSPQRLQLCRTTQVSNTHITYDPACAPSRVVPVILRITLDLGFAWAILTQTSALETEASSWPAAFPPVPFLHSANRPRPSLLLCFRVASQPCFSLASACGHTVCALGPPRISSLYPQGLVLCIWWASPLCLGLPWWLRR